MIDYDRTQWFGLCARAPRSRLHAARAFSAATPSPRAAGTRECTQRRRRASLHARPLLTRRRARAAYLLTIRGSLLPRCFPLMVFAGTISGLVASGRVDEWTDYDVLDVFGDQYAMQLFGVVFGYLSVARLNISYNRYWEGITNLKQMHSKWFDACMQIIAFDQILQEDLCPRKDPFCRHVCTLFIQLSAMATLVLRVTHYSPVQIEAVRRAQQARRAARSAHPDRAGTPGARVLTRGAPRVAGEPRPAVGRRAGAAGQG
jgi:hypothetical protein